MSYTLSSSHTNFRNLHLVIISNACYSNGTHLFLALHGMQGGQGFKSPWLHLILLVITIDYDDSYKNNLLSDSYKILKQTRGNLIMFLII